MQAVILAAGRGTRMKDRTDAVPKPLLQVAGRSLLEYSFDALPEHVDEIIIIVGYLGGMIHDRFGADYFGKRMLYVEQEQLNGTGGALWLAKDILHDAFIVMNADDIYAREDIARVADAKDWAMLVSTEGSIKEGGKVQSDKHGHIVKIVEGVHDGLPGLVCTNVYKLDTRIFSGELVPKAPASEEFGLPQTVLQAAESLHIPLEAVMATSWIKITSPEDLEKAEKILQPHI